MAKLKSYVPTVTFVVVWSSCTTLAEAAKKLAMTPKSAGARASHLRTRGVKLKQLRPTKQSKKSMVEVLNALIQ